MLVFSKYTKFSKSAIELLIVFYEKGYEFVSESGNHFYNIVYCIILCMHIYIFKYYTYIINKYI